MSDSVLTTSAARFVAAFLRSRLDQTAYEATLVHLSDIETEAGGEATPTSEPAAVGRDNTDKAYMSGSWEFGQHEALWGDSEPSTPEGERLLRLFKDGKIGTSAAGIRDFRQRICQIETESAGRALLRADQRRGRA